MKWPKRGVYFFMEPGEVRAETGDGPRIVRVGTHALKTGAKTKLWSRLKQHKGTASSGGGNHRGSIFRLIVGTTLIQKEDLDYPTWGKGGTAPREVRKLEQPLERKVSTIIGDMPFLWLAIEDEPGPDSLRGYIERNAIALLSNYNHEKHPTDSSSQSWLGRYCDREKVRISGLWNSNHVDEDYDSAFLDVLARLIDEMEIPG